MRGRGAFHPAMRRGGRCCCDRRSFAVNPRASIGIVDRQSDRSIGPPGGGSTGRACSVSDV
jgi:hypothetical protein